jgi:hypothetical protein
MRKAETTSVDYQALSLNEQIAQAVAYYWRTRQRQQERQSAQGRSDQGARGAVTGGSQMVGFCELITHLLVEAGITPAHIFSRQSLERTSRVLSPYQRVGHAGCP